MGSRARWPESTARATRARFSVRVAARRTAGSSDPSSTYYYASRVECYNDTEKRAVHDARAHSKVLPIRSHHKGPRGRRGRPDAAGPKAVYESDDLS